MSRRRKQRLTRTVVVSVVLVGLLVYAGIRFFTTEEDKGAGGAIGPGVTVSGGFLPDGLKAVPASTEGLPYPSAMKSISTPVRITPDGELRDKSGKLTRITLRFKLNRKVDPARELVLVATSETGKAPWDLLKPRISADGMYAEVDTSHLSVWSVIGGNFSVLPNPVSEDFAKDLKNALIGTHEPAQKPKCDRPPSKDDPSGYGASYPDDKDALYVCMNKEGDDYILYIVNRKPYPLDVTYTANLKPSHKGETNASWGNLIPSPGKNRFILFPRDKAAFKLDLKSGDSGRISTELSGYGQSLYQLDVGLATLSSIIDRFGIGAPDPGTAEFLDEMKKMMQYKDCANALSNNKGVGEIYATCLPHLAAGDPFGQVGTEIVLNAIKTVNSLKDYVASEFRSIWESLRDADKFSILVGRTYSYERFVGVWNTHGTTLRIRSGGSGSIVSNAGPCTPSDWSNTEMCEEHGTLSLKEDGLKLVGIITEVTFTSDGGDQYVSCDVEVCGDVSSKGVRFSLEYVSAGQLKVKYSGATGATVYFCNSKSTKQERVNCGA